MLALAMSLSLVACGGGGTTSTPADTSKPAASGEKIELDIMAAEYGTNTAAWW